MRSLPLIALVAAACGSHHSSPPQLTTGRAWIVSPRGPLDLAQVLVSPDVKPGDAILLRTGIYRVPDRSDGNLGFRIRLHGDAKRPITIASFPGEHAVIDGGLTDKDGACSHVRIRDLEILVSENLKATGVSKQNGSWPSDLGRPAGGVNLFNAHDVKVINNVIHHNAVGVSMWGPVSGNSEIYGNLIYANGWLAPDRHHGHGIYMQNSSTDYKYVVENLIFDNYDLNVQAYGSPRASVARIVVARNVVYSGSRTEDGRLLIGGYAPFSGVKAIDNVLYRSALQVGYAHTGGDQAVVTGNTVWKNDVFIENENNITKLRAKNNFAWPADREPKLDDAPVAAPKPRVILQRNAYDAKRALLTILNFSKAPVVDVDFAGFLKVGDTYELKAPDRFYGRPVSVGKYEGKPVPMKLTSEFATFIVRRTTK